MAMRPRVSRVEIRAIFDESNYYSGTSDLTRKVVLLKGVLCVRMAEFIYDIYNLLIDSFDRDREESQCAGHPCTLRKAEAVAADADLLAHCPCIRSEEI